MATTKKTAKTQKIKAPSIVTSLEAGFKAIQDQAPAKAEKASKKVAAAPKPKRVSLNPQPTIDAKVAALKELGVKLIYAARTWKAGDKTWTSQEFSKLSVESLT
jgi:hypothetical protein